MRFDELPQKQKTAVIILRMLAITLSIAKNLENANHYRSLLPEKRRPQFRNGFSVGLIV